MIHIKIRSLFKGKVAIRDKYILEAQDKSEDLLLIYKGEQMRIPCDDIAFDAVGQSKETYPDNFSNERHHLVYFKWKPQIMQGNLFKNLKVAKQNIN